MDLKAYFLNLAQNRQSVRGYLDQEVPRPKIERCLEAARLAPSACNSQPWYFIVIDDQALRREVAQETFGTFLSFNHFSLQAPVLVVMLVEASNLTASLGSKIKNKQYNLIDAGIAAEHFCLQAASEGLGTCILGWFNEKAVKRILQLPSNKRVELIITLGYPSDNAVRAKSRKQLYDIFNYNNNLV